MRIKVVYSGIGPVTHSDVQLAAAAGASILAFNVRSAAPAVEAAAKQSSVTTCSQVTPSSHTLNPEPLFEPYHGYIVRKCLLFIWTIRTAEKGASTRENVLRAA